MTEAELRKQRIELFLAMMREQASKLKYSPEFLAKLDMDWEAAFGEGKKL